MGPEQMQQMMATLLPQLFANAARTAAVGGGGYDWLGNPEAAIRIIKEIVDGLPEELQGQFRGTGGPAEGADIPTFRPDDATMEDLGSAARAAGRFVGQLPGQISDVASEFWTDQQGRAALESNIRPEYSAQRQAIVRTFQELAAPGSNATPEELQAFRDTYFIPSQK